MSLHLAPVSLGAIMLCVLKPYPDPTWGPLLSSTQCPLALCVLRLPWVDFWGFPGWDVTCSIPLTHSCCRATAEMKYWSHFSKIYTAIV